MKLLDAAQVEYFRRHRYAVEVLFEDEVTWVEVGVAYDSLLAHALLDYLRSAGWKARYVSKKED